MKKIVYSVLCFLMTTFVFFAVSSPLKAEAASKTYNVTVKLSKKGTKQNISLAKGYKINLTGQIGKKTYTGKKLKYSSDKPKIATVSSKGIITAKKTGKVKITVTTKDKKQKTVINLNVVKKVPVKKVKLNKTTLTLKKGKTAKLTFTLNPVTSTNQKATWKSSNTKVVSVSKSGKLSAKKAGKATITVKVDGKKATCKVTVKDTTKKETNDKTDKEDDNSDKTIKVSEIKLSDTSKTIPTGNSFTLIANVTPSNASNRSVKYSSSNTAVATVTSNGTVKGISAGQATITCTAQDSSGISTTCTVTVIDAVLYGDSGNVKYALYKTSNTPTYKLEITGNGSMADYEYNLDSPTPWDVYRTQITELSIGNGVTHIGDYAFYKLTAITSVSMPSSVTSLGNKSFYMCTSLSGLNLGNVKTIGIEAFSNDSSLEKVVIPGSVTTLGEKAFYYCTKLSTLVLNEGLITIDNSVFAHDSALAGKLIIPATVTSIGNNAFNMYDFDNDNTCTSNLTGLEFASGSKLKSIGTGAFNYNRKFTGIIVFPDSLESIGDSAFSYCCPGRKDFSSGISGISFGTNSNLKTIGASAFSSTDTIASVVLPASVTSIGNYAFDQSPAEDYCKLRNIYYRGSAEQYWNLCSNEAITADNDFIRVANSGNERITVHGLTGDFDINISYNYTG